MGNKEAIEVRRFIAVRRALGYTQSEFAKLLGVPNTTADIERGRTKISGKAVAVMLGSFNINPLWLFGDSDQQYLKPHSVDTIPKVVTVDNTSGENMVLVNAKAAAGYPQNIQDVSWYRQLPAFNMPLPEFRNATYRGFQVEGDSMLPNLRPGEWVLAKAVEDIAHIRPNKMYVVVLQDAVLVKKITWGVQSNTLQLISLNEEYPAYAVALGTVQELWEVSSKITFGLDASTDRGLLKQLQASMEDLKQQLKSRDGL